MLVGECALVVAALFSGAALYINLAEHPARLQLADEPLLTQWKPSYKRGFALQASLAIVGFGFGLWAWFLTGDWRFGLGGLVLVTNWPFTLVMIMPVNNRLMAMSAASPAPDMRKLMQQWGQLHGVRSGLGVLATTIFVWAMH